jgi:serine/threonine protein phosphatase PrpC
VTAIGANASGYTITDDVSHASVTLSWAAGTDVGHHRADNEDSYVVAAPVFAVADGMGGHSAGDVASDAVVRGLATLQSSGFTSTEAIDGALSAAVKGLGQVLEEDQRGAGTTVTGAALVLNESAVDWAVFNIGDSRVYVLFDNQFVQVTVDHSVVQQLVDSGQITRDEADYHPHSNVITRAVGLAEEPVPDYFTFQVAAGMRLLMCSDGLTKELTDAGIEHFLVSAPTPEDAVEELMRAALNNSGRDNVTVIVIDVHGVNPPLIHG